VWLVGAYGNVATLAVTGARAVARGETSTTGLVTEREPVASLDLPGVADLVFAGHDVRDADLVAEAERQAERDGVPDRETLDAVKDDLAAIDDRVRTGTARNAGETIAALADDEKPASSLRGVVESIQGDYAAFAREHDLDRVVVVNVASTEPGVADADRYDTLGAFEDALDRDDSDVPASALYAYAAIDAGHLYVNFTPSVGSDLGGLRDLAAERNVPHVGRDAKTGETLVKSALAPMFAGRNLRVLAWEGHNVLGNPDGKVLETDENEAGKLASKGGVLDAVLPDHDHSAVRIDYTPSLGDWKTAWDYVHFRGFLDTEMTMQFTWEGSDSALAAPLVLDLARLVVYADERGEGGLQPHLASFFKAPMGVDEHDFSRQVARLDEWARDHLEAEAAVDGHATDGGSDAG
jgi:myo-inositol-1-phosphate synthase